MRREKSPRTEEGENYLPAGRIVLLSGIVLATGFLVIPSIAGSVRLLPDSIAFMALPFLACLILTGIHTYLGVHVITRGVIFVDLSLAQIAALGATCAFLLGYPADSTYSYLISLGFTFMGAGVFAYSRLTEKDIPQEAIIGIVYACAGALTILTISHAPHGAEHIEEMLTGSILWVRAETIVHTAGIYGLVGVFHIIFFRMFDRISTDPAKARSSGLSVRFWDFLFYLSFGFVITSSVAIAGVLLVFSFLVVPAVLSSLFTQKMGSRLLIGWTLGTVVSVTGLTVSYTYDFSSGPVVVTLFGISLIAVWVGKSLVARFR